MTSLEYERLKLKGLCVYSTGCGAKAGDASVFCETHRLRSNALQVAARGRNPELRERVNQSNRRWRMARFRRWKCSRCNRDRAACSFFCLECEAVLRTLSPKETANATTAAPALPAQRLPQARPAAR